MFVTKQQQQQQQQLYFALIQIIRNKKENKKQKWNFYRKAGGKVEKKIELIRRQSNSAHRCPSAIKFKISLECASVN